MLTSSGYSSCHFPGGPFIYKKKKNPNKTCKVHPLMLPEMTSSEQLRRLIFLEFLEL